MPRVRLADPRGESSACVGTDPGHRMLWLLGVPTLLFVAPAPPTRLAALPVARAAPTMAAAPSSLDHDEIRRYSRHLILADVGMEGQARLKASKVLCIGSGGLGSPALMYLAAAGA